MTYNGYTNYETWELCLEYNNDQGLQEMMQEYARDAYLARGGEENDDGQLVMDEDIIYDVAEDIKDYVEDMLTEIYPELENQQLIVMTAVRTFLQAVNWVEVAECFLE